MVDQPKDPFDAFQKPGDAVPPKEAAAPQPAAPVSPYSVDNTPAGGIDPARVGAVPPAAAEAGMGYKQVFNEAKAGTLLNNFEAGAKEAEFAKMGFTKRLTAKLGGNWSKAGGTSGKLKLVGGGLATAYFGSGLVMDAGRLVGLVPLKKDAATNQDIPVGLGTVVIDAAGTAAGIWAATHGGHRPAMGIA